MKVKTFLFLSATLVGAFHPALAQTAPGTSEAPPSNAGRDQASAASATATPATAADAPLAPGEIVVTAQRRAESLQRVPLAVTVATRAQLEARNFTNPAQLPLLVPSLQVTNYQASPGATNFSVRGIGTASFSHLIEPSVATVIDGVVMGRPEMGVMEFSDLERVEVLDGPQGMLFGKNASAGLVNIVTTRPRLNTTSLDAEASYGNVDAASHVNSWRGNATINLPLSDIAAARFTGYVARDGSLVGNRNPDGYDDFGRTQYGFRGKALLDPGNGFTFYLSGDYSHSSGMGTGVYTARQDAPGGTFQKLDQQYGITASPNNLFQSSDAPTDLHFNVGGIQGELGYQFANGVTITNITAWRSYDSHHTIDFDLRPVDIVDVSAASFRFRQVTEELRVASPSNVPLEYQVGLFYYHGTSDRTDLTRGQLGFGAPPPGYEAWLGLHGENDLVTNSYAAYGQATWHLTPKFSLTGGGRVTHDSLRLYGTDDNNGFLIGIQGQPGANIYTPSESNTNFSWRASGRYEFTPQISGYVTVARGYKGPGSTSAGAAYPGQRRSVPRLRWITRRASSRCCSAACCSTSRPIGRISVTSRRRPSGTRTPPASEPS